MAGRVAEREGVNDNAGARCKRSETAANRWVLFVKRDDAVTSAPLHAEDRSEYRLRGAVADGNKFEIGGKHAGEDAAQLVGALFDVIHGVLGGAPRLQLLVMHGAHCRVDLGRHWAVASRIQVDARLC